ncbi:hypothetical protein JQ604_35890 [Bradyrhizobium jicamae]|uniref:hypothetical protein n=1 Tax=Bradyrhizobium jicamae TaxID=280332 RepID=UPI001BA44ADF|nr:hypothetical protein [Bradyrhizobium jicamae]MBR0757592.1 hypothetical protein [Bradyrhizobium jicamae]
MDIKKLLGGGVVASALAGAFGTYYTTHNKCMEEANSAITDYRDLVNELQQRLYFLAEAGDRSHNSVAEFAKQIAPIRFHLARFKDTRTSELLEMEHALEAKFYPSSSIRFYLSQALDPKSLYILDSVLSGTVPTPYVSENDMPYLESVLMKLRDALLTQANIKLEPQCAIIQTTSMMFGYKTEIVDKLLVTPPQVPQASQ